MIVSISKRRVKYNLSKDSPRQRKSARKKSKELEKGDDELHLAILVYLLECSAIERWKG